jgi:hypothetical protein
MYRAGLILGADHNGRRNLPLFDVEAEIEDRGAVGDPAPNS